MADQALDILKQAILMERRGNALYRKVADQARNSEVRDFFEMMAREEETHMEVLSEQLKIYSTDNKFGPMDHTSDMNSDIISKLFTEDIITKIRSAGFEAAAISAALSMEERAEKIYRDRAKATDDPEEKKLYQWLAEWEQAHLKALSKMDRMLTEKIWNDNHFWPF